MEITPISFKQNPSRLNQIVKKANIKNWSNESKKMFGTFYPALSGGAVISTMLISPYIALFAGLAAIASYVPVLNMCMPKNEKEDTELNKIA